MDPARELPQLLEGDRELYLGLVEEPLRELGIGCLALRCQSQLEGQRDQLLLRAVMEIPLEAPPLRVRRLDQPRPRRPELRLCAFAVVDIAEKAGEHRRAGNVDARDRELDRELAPVRAHAGELEPRVEVDRAA